LKTENILKEVFFVKGKAGLRSRERLVFQNKMAIVRFIFSIGPERPMTCLLWADNMVPENLSRRITVEDVVFGSFLTVRKNPV
jgi:hypothetical protein